MAEQTGARLVALEDSPLARPGVTVLVGHAGVGKTNLALNLALALARSGRPVTLADLDLVNPYFRSSDYDAQLRAAGVRVVAPVFARTSLDTPSLGGELPGAIERASRGGDEHLVLDVGGDDSGATALGRYARELAGAGARMYYVVNAFRNLTHTPAEAYDVLAEVEAHARLAACGVVNCSNLAAETSARHVAAGRAFAREVARLASLPLVASVVPEALGARGLAGCGEGDEPLVGVRRLVHAPWE